MKVHVIGGGPAGLYFSILMKKAWPQTRITVFERNRPDDTFGFGVVFSDQTLDTFESYDRESYRAIIGHFAYWDDIEIHFRGATHRIGGNGFCGCSRGTLLKILGRRARSLGVEIRYQSEISPLDPAIRDADLVVVADGINSRMRDAFADRFKPSVDLRPNFFSWISSTRRRPRISSSRCSRRSCRATGSAPPARSGATSRPSAASDGSRTTWC